MLRAHGVLPTYWPGRHVRAAGFRIGCLLVGSGGLLLPLGGLGGCSLSFQFGLGLADPLQPAGTPLEFFRQLITLFVPADLAVFLGIDELGLAQQRPHLSFQLSRVNQVDWLRQSG